MRAAVNPFLAAGAAMVAYALEESTVTRPTVLMRRSAFLDASCNAYGNGTTASPPVTT